MSESGPSNPGSVFQSADPQNHQQVADHPFLFFFFLVESNEETARLHSKEKSNNLKLILEMDFQNLEQVDSFREELTKTQKGNRIFLSDHRTCHANMSSIQVDPTMNLIQLRTAVYPSPHSCGVS